MANENLQNTLNTEPISVFLFIMMIVSKDLY